MHQPLLGLLILLLATPLVTGMAAPAEPDSTAVIVLPEWKPPQLESRPSDASLPEREVLPAPPGYVRLDMIPMRAKVPGTTYVDFVTNIRAFFLARYPAIEHDREGLNAVILALSRLARDFNGVLEQHAFNNVVTFYNHYTHIASSIDALPVDPAFLSSLKDYYAREVLESGVRRFKLAEIRDQLAAINSDFKVAQTMAGDTPDAFFERNLPAYRDMTEDEKAIFLDALLPFNPWLTRVNRIDLSDRSPMRMPIVGQTELLHRQGGYRYLSHYSLEPNRFLAFPPSNHIREFLSRAVNVVSEE